MKANRVINFRPHLKQHQCWQKLTDATTTEILYGGSVGNGKSYLGCAWVILSCLQYPGIRVLVGRSHLTHLRLTTIKTLLGLLKEWQLDGQQTLYNKQTNTITFFNGSEIIFKDLQFQPSDPEFDSLGSLEITMAFVDEASQITLKCWEVLKSRLRYRLDDYGLIPKILGTCNPAQNWIFDRFYLPWEQGRLDSWKAFIPAVTEDNQHLPESYVKELYKLDEATKKRLLFGDWHFSHDDQDLFKVETILNAFQNPPSHGGAYHIVVDVASSGQDRTVISLWLGLRCVILDLHSQWNTQMIVDAVLDLRTKYKVDPSKVIVDAIGVGTGVADLLVGCTRFMGSNKAVSPTFFNIKSECAFALAAALAQGSICIDDTRSHIKESLMRELPAYRKYKADTDNKLRITPKDVVKQSLGFSPDIADNFIMRMICELKKQSFSYEIIN